MHHDLHHINVYACVIGFQKYALVFPQTHRARVVWVHEEDMDLIFSNVVVGYPFLWNLVVLMVVIGSSDSCFYTLILT